MSFAQLLTEPFVHTALQAGAVVAVVSGAIGVFVVIRGMSFAVHAVSELGFTGAAGALVLGADPVVGLLVGSLAVGAILGLLTVRGRERDSAIGSFLAFGLGIGVLLISLYQGYATQATSLLFGSIVGVSQRQLELLVVVAVFVLLSLALSYRPLLFASVDPEGAEARGVSLRMVSVILLLLVALTTAEAIQVVGVLLVLTLVITPAAAATRLTARPGLALVFSICIALAATEGGILLSLWKPYPTSFFISALSFSAYVVARLVGAARAARAGRALAGHHEARSTRLTIAFLVGLAVLSLMPDAIGSKPPVVRDVGPMVGFRRHESSYTIAVADVNGDGWPDVLIGHHGSRPAELFMNQPLHGRSIGFEPVFRLVDTIHGRPDRHGCTFGDPNVDGLIDILCMKGARQGTAKKWNELWIQGPRSTWVDKAHQWGIEDVWGRGRHPAWIDLNGDRYPDLFLGNDEPRYDNHVTPNRTFVNVGGKRFRQVDLGITRQDGSACEQVLDINHDGRDDLLLCGDKQTILYVRQGDGFVQENERYGVPRYPIANGARITDVSGDGIPDLVLVHLHDLEVRFGRPDGSFGPPVLTRHLEHGHGLAIGDVNGDGAPDIYAVDGCADRVNAPDVLLLNGGDGTTWTQIALPLLPPGELAGCGDTAMMVDFDRDGMQDIVVLNGGGNDQPLDLDGPDQLLTLGSWQPLR